MEAKNTQLKDVKYIFTADDFGPIDFINQGIYKAVDRGMVNSVQVLVNGDTQESLKTKLALLAKKVKDGQTLDLGLHLTLTSGKPVYTAGDWGEILDSDGNFKDFKEFHFGYGDKMDTIKKEFAAQEKLLVDTLKDLGSEKLILSCVSNHHNILAIGHDIFDAYLNVGGKSKSKLAFRSLKALPKFSMFMYYNFVLPIGNKTDKKAQRKTMKKMNKAFAKTQFKGDKDVELKSPSYLEAGFYSALGTKGRMKKMRGGKINRKLKKLTKMVAESTQDEHYIETGQTNNKVVEFVFHIGNPSDFKRDYSTNTKHYKGVTPMYFDNRIVEFKALEKLKKENKHPHVFNNLVSWQNCNPITYKKL